MTTISRCCLSGLLACLGAPLFAGTVALWLFDEPGSVYPSSTLSDAGPNNYILALGRGARMAEGRYGRALAPQEPAPLTPRGTSIGDNKESSLLFGLIQAPTPAGRKLPPMTWQTATFAALLTAGETHLRKPAFANATDTKLNLGAFNWTVELWCLPAGGSTEGVLWELGEGPRGENNHVTRLSLEPSREAFVLENQPSGAKVRLTTEPSALRGSRWVHLAFVYDAASRRLHHFVDGRERGSADAALQALPHGNEAYLSIGRDGLWQRPFPGRLDELRVSDEALYTASFTPPGSFSLTYSGRLPQTNLPKGPPLLFAADGAKAPIALGSRKHLFLDDALLADRQHVEFVPNPPKRAEKVFDNLIGHMSLVQDDTGLLRLYYRGPQDSLAVMTSKDGVHWTKPDLGQGEYHGEKNVVLREPVGLGNVFLDPNAPPEGRWVYVSGIRRQSIYVFRSSDGWSFRRHETAALPFAAGSQSVTYYDDQRQLYVAHHRSDYGETPGGATDRRYLRSETAHLLEPWPWTPATPERTAAADETRKTHAGKLDPWFLDNGPLAPGGFGIELPTVLARDPEIDPVGTDLYVTKVSKYPWAPDAYLAFPSVYFHYWEDGPKTRQILGSKERKRGSGVTETQLAVSRDGLTWKRYPRPAYAPIGGDGSNDTHMLFLVAGMVRRGDEIWQYVTGHPGNGIGYHSAWQKGRPSPVWRLVQRLDGFVAAEGAYTGGQIKTKPLIFSGRSLELNVDTGAVGWAAVGLLDAQGHPIPGYSIEDCVQINGDFLHARVEWLGKGTDVSAIAGRPVQVVIQLRGARLYAMQFVEKADLP